MIEDLLQERLRLAIKYMLVQVLEEEVNAFVNAAPYQRTPERRDQRNGKYERDLGTSMGVIEDLPVPRTRPPQSKFRKSRWQGLFSLYLTITELLKQRLHIILRERLEETGFVGDDAFYKGAFLFL
jgi:transposase-like protein